jgi:hypothetical protein
LPTKQQNPIHHYLAIGVSAGTFHSGALLFLGWLTRLACNGRQRRCPDHSATSLKGFRIPGYNLLRGGALFGGSIGYSLSVANHQLTVKIFSAYI